MKAFLADKSPEIQLTRKELTLLGDATLPESLRSLLWTRTCDLQRKPDPQRERHTALLCFYHTQQSTNPALQPWHA